jgi:hypothetical protein
MTAREDEIIGNGGDRGADNNWVLSSLEHDQLVRAKKHPIPRRRLKGAELAVLWGLRIYLLFMMAVVFYQVWTAAH